MFDVCQNEYIPELIIETSKRYETIKKLIIYYNSNFNICREYFYPIPYL